MWVCCDDDGMCGECGGTDLGLAKIKLANAAIAYYRKEIEACEQDQAWARGEVEFLEPRLSTSTEYLTMWRAMQEVVELEDKKV